MMNYKKDLMDAFQELFPGGFFGFDPAKPCPPPDRESYIASLLPGFEPINEEVLVAAAEATRQKKGERRVKKLAVASFASSLVASIANGDAIDKRDLELAVGLMMARNGGIRSEIDAMESAIAGRG